MSNINFEKSLDKLSTIVDKLEEGGLSLDQSLKHFESGVTLIRDCQKALTEAEQKVKILTENQGDAKLEPFSTQSGEDA